MNAWTEAEWRWNKDKEELEEINLPKKLTDNNKKGEQPGKENGLGNIL